MIISFVGSTTGTGCTTLADKTAEKLYNNNKSVLLVTNERDIESDKEFNILDLGVFPLNEACKVSDIVFLVVDTSSSSFSKTIMKDKSKIRLVVNKIDSRSPYTIEDICSWHGFKDCISVPKVKNIEKININPIVDIILEKDVLHKQTIKIDEKKEKSNNYIEPIKDTFDSVKNDKRTFVDNINTVNDTLTNIKAIKNIFRNDIKTTKNISSENIETAKAQLAGMFKLLDVKPKSSNLNEMLVELEQEIINLIIT
ncbi:hypothetical protein PQ692_10150 [Thermoanaerobacterium thermosaccharolyticum]|uniref:hypothetical protein n=1 Tax=Thermoanaerobacterium thermosaccharolyticum TaxID=1517 RepID=UPI003D29EC35